MDANICIKLFLNYEEDSELVADLFADQLQNPLAPIIAIPGFFYIECASILRKAVRAGQYDSGQARRDLSDLEQMGLYTVPTVEVAGEAFEISSVYGTSVYDASYVAVAHRLGVPLVTADQRLINGLSNSPYTLYTLHDHLAVK